MIKPFELLPIGALLKKISKSKSKSMEISDFYAAALSGGNDLLFVFNQNLALTCACESGEKLLGIKPADLEGRTVAQLTPPTSSQSFESYLHSLFDMTYSGGPFLYQLLNSAGHGVWFEATGGPILIEGVSHVAIVSRCVQEKMIMEQSLRATNERFKLAMAVGGIGVWDWDIQTGRLFMDAHTTQIYGVGTGPETSLFDLLKTVCHPNDYPSLKKEIEWAIQDNHYFETHFRVGTAEPDVRFVRLVGKVLVDTDQKPVRVIGLNWDETQKQKDAQKLTEANMALVNSSKMASLGEMAGGVAHEINNPLAIIQGKAEQLKRRIQEGIVDKEKVISDLERISANSLRIAKIIRGLKAFSRNAEKDPFSPASLKLIVDDSLELCQERFKHHGVDLRVSEIPDLNLNCRPSQISQVIVNLLNNAFDAVLGTNAPWIEIRCEHNGPSVQIKILDGGAGISHEISDKIMQPFFTTKDIGKGTGLGLSIGKGIIEDHFGRLFLDSSQPHTCFVIQLPLVEQESAATA